MIGDSNEAFHTEHVIGVNMPIIGTQICYPIIAFILQQL